MASRSWTLAWSAIRKASSRTASAAFRRRAETEVERLAEDGGIEIVSSVGPGPTDRLGLTEDLASAGDGVDTSGETPFLMARIIPCSRVVTTASILAITDSTCRGLDNPVEFTSSRVSIATCATSREESRRSTAAPAMSCSASPRYSG